MSFKLIHHQITFEENVILHAIKKINIMILGDVTWYQSNIPTLGLIGSFAYEETRGTNFICKYLCREI